MRGAGLRKELVRAYRSLLTTCKTIEPAKFGHADAFLEDHIVFRIRTERHLAKEDMAAAKQTHPSDASLEEAVQNMRTLEQVLGKMALLEPADAPALFSFLTATQATGGDPEYHRDLEAGLLRMAAFVDDFQERVATEQERGGETKDRAMQVACREYSEVVEMMEQHPAEGSDGGDKLLELLRARKPKCEYRMFTSPETVLIETDHDRRRVTLFVRSHLDIRENAMDEHVQLQEWALEPEGTQFQADYHQAALHILKELTGQKKETLFPEEYAVCLSGHSIGGALAAIVAVYLRAEHSMDVVNVVTFGQPKLTTTMGCQALFDLPLLRITTPLDAFQHTPTMSDMDEEFCVYGENLSVLPYRLAAAIPNIAEFADENAVYVTASEYHRLLLDDKAVLEWESSPEYLPQSSPDDGDLGNIDQDELDTSRFKLWRDRTPRRLRKDK
eukprot:Rhum_TRINITY_DN23261_c0_g1::Rhum_TRINITY_DN23261_c0_g1_i1::g.177554::m.177554